MQKLPCLSSKYIVTPDKFSLNNHGDLVFVIDNSNIKFRQYLPIIGRNLLVHLVSLINANDNYDNDDIYDICKKMKTPELINYLTERIEFQIPEELIAFKREGILNKYKDFPKIYIPLTNHSDSSFHYDIYSARLGGHKFSTLFKYPFSTSTDKYDLIMLCVTIKIMNKSTATKYKIGELIELLNDKFVLEER